MQKGQTRTLVKVNHARHSLSPRRERKGRVRGKVNIQNTTNQTGLADLHLLNK